MFASPQAAATRSSRSEEGDNHVKDDRPRQNLAETRRMLGAGNGYEGNWLGTTPAPCGGPTGSSGPGFPNGSPAIRAAAGGGKTGGSFGRASPETSGGVALPVAALNRSLASAMHARIPPSPHPRACIIRVDALRRIGDPYSCPSSGASRASAVGCRVFNHSKISAVREGLDDVVPVLLFGVAAGLMAVRPPMCRFTYSGIPPLARAIPACM
jgi:hypothetical protein